MRARTILLVEDNDDDVSLFLRAVRDTGISSDVVVARDGGDALDYLLGDGANAPRSGTELPWIVLLDLKLPRIDGLETLARLRAHRRTKLLPVIIFSSSNEVSDVVASYTLGANSYLRKPDDYGDLMTLVERIHAYWRSNELPPPGPSS